MGTCSVEGCRKPAKTRGWCEMHYNRWRRHGDTGIALRKVTTRKPGQRRERAKCSVAGCDRNIEGHGLCNKHYQRWKKYGDPLMVQKDPERTVEQRFWSFVNKNGPVPAKKPELGPCWAWTGGLAGGGYGAFSIKNRQFKPHILSYTWAKGEIPEDWECDHLCFNRACVNPDHLEAVTARINQHRSDSPWGINARKTHCPADHEYTPENTYVYKGQRRCRECARRRTREWWAANRSAAARAVSVA